MYIAYASSGSTISPIWSYVMILAIFAALYFFTIRPQNKRDKELRNLRNNLKPGDEIITIGGIYGKIVRVTEDRVVIMVGSEKTKLEMAKSAISGFADASASAASSKSKAEVTPEKESTKPSAKNIKKLGAAKETAETEPAQETAENKEA